MADRSTNACSHEHTYHVSYSASHPDSPSPVTWDIPGIHNPTHFFSFNTWPLTGSAISISDQDPYIKTPVVRKWKCCCCPAPLKTTLNPKCSCGHNRCSSCAVFEYIQQGQESLDDNSAAVDITQSQNRAEHSQYPETNLVSTVLDVASGKDPSSSETSQISNTLSHKQKSQHKQLITRTLTLTHSAMAASLHDPSTYPEATYIARRSTDGCETILACQQCQHYHCSACGVINLEIPWWDSLR